MTGGNLTNGRFRLIFHSLLILMAVPAAVWLGRVIMPPGGERDIIRRIILLFVLVPSFSLYFGWLYLRLRNPAWGLKLILLGTLFRLTLLMAMGLWFRIERPELERSGLFLYLITSGCFLFFELVAIVGFRIGFGIESNVKTDAVAKGPTTD